MNASTLHAGLADPVHGAQRAFRAVLDALARPGRIEAVGEPIPGLGLAPAQSHLLLALADEDTPVWWQSPAEGLARWLRFHTGARQAADAASASFAVLTDPASLPPLRAFQPGTLERPESSCTLLVELPSLREGPLLHAAGPGIQTRQPLRLAGLPDGFWSQWHANHASFPQGVDLLFTCGSELLGLPRTTRVEP